MQELSDAGLRLIQKLGSETNVSSVRESKIVLYVICFSSNDCVGNALAGAMLFY